MSTATDLVRLDKEYEALLDSVISAKNARIPHPTLVSGLCEGASDAVFASLI